MKDLAKRFPQNPLLKPADLEASSAGLQIACLLNPGVFSFNNKIWLLVRVAERPPQSKVVISFLIKNALGNTEIMELPLNDADLITTDARLINYKGEDCLTTLSHLRLLCSDDGIHFTENDAFLRCMVRDFWKLLELKIAV